MAPTTSADEKSVTKVGIEHGDGQSSIFWGDTWTSVNPPYARFNGIFMCGREVNERIWFTADPITFDAAHPDFGVRQAALYVEMMTDGYIHLNTTITLHSGKFLYVESVFGGSATQPPITHMLNVEKKGEAAVRVDNYFALSPVLNANIALYANNSVGYDIHAIQASGVLNLSPIVLVGSGTKGVKVKTVHNSVTFRAKMNKVSIATGTIYYEISRIAADATDVQVVMMRRWDFFDEESVGVRVVGSERGATLTADGVTTATVGKVIALGKAYAGKFRLGSGGHKVSDKGVLAHLDGGFEGTADLTAEKDLNGKHLVQVGGQPHPDATLLVQACKQVNDAVKDAFGKVGATIKDAASVSCIDQSTVASAMPTSLPTLGAVGLAVVGCAVGVVGLCAVLAVKGVFAKRSKEDGAHENVSRL